MEALVIEPRTKSEARFVKDFTKRLGIPAKTVNAVDEEIDDFLFGKELVERRKNFKIVPEEEYKKMVARKLAE